MEYLAVNFTRKSRLSGVTRTKTFMVTEAEMTKYMQGELIQKAFPTLSDGDREFILTGITDEEWNETFADDETEWGCEHCRNDGKLNESNRCPKCDAEFPDET